MQFSAKHPEQNVNMMSSHYGHTNLFVGPSSQQSAAAQNYRQSYQQNQCYLQQNHNQNHNNQHNSHHHHQLHLKPTNQNLVHKQSQSASRLRQLTEFAVQQRQQAVANELAAKAAEAAAAAALARHQQELATLERDAHYEPQYVDEQVAFGATQPMMIDSPQEAPEAFEQPVRQRVNSIGRLGLAPSSPPAPFTSRSVSFSSGVCGVRQVASSPARSTGVGDQCRCEACSFGPAGGQCLSSGGGGCPAPCAAPASLDTASSPASSYLGSNLSPRSNRQSPALSGSQLGGSMSANDALSLGINLEQYISKRNERERSRVRNVNDAFDNLKNSLPLELDKMSKRMSKVEILRTAIGYIRDLEGVLGSKQQHHQQQQQENCMQPRHLTLVGGPNYNLNHENTTQQVEPTSAGVLMTNSQQYLNQPKEQLYEINNNNNNSNYCL